MEPEKALRAGIDAWAGWRKAHAGSFPDLRGLQCEGEDLSGFDLSRCNLHGANFTRAQLDGADLRHCDLVQARFGSARLHGTRFHGANLRKCVLYRADMTATDLTQCNLHRATLDGARLSGTDLQFATFTHCSFAGTDFDGAIMGGTSITGGDLGKAVNLEGVVHTRKSSIGVDTLELSRGDLPAAFLRGCGVAERFMKVSADRSDPGYCSAFISYSHEDKDFAERLFATLQAHGVRCWLDDHALAFGADIREEIDSGIAEHDRVLLCCSRHSLESCWVDKELERALAKEEQLWRKHRSRTLTILPLNLDGYLVEGWDGSRSVEIRSRLAADFEGWREDDAVFERSVARVVQALRMPDDDART